MTMFFPTILLLGDIRLTGNNYLEPLIVERERASLHPF